MDKPDLRSGITDRQCAGQLMVYGLAHAVVDALCAGVLLTLWKHQVMSPLEVGWLFVFYNLLAFGVQPVMGIILDRIQRPRLGIMAGCLITAGATIGFEQWPIASVALAGIGNALFHLGAGTICLNLTPGRATAPGIFVAPGAFGLFLGTYLGKEGQFISWPFIALLSVLGAVMMVMKVPSINYRRECAPDHSGWMRPALILLLACIAIRSLVGQGLELPWKSNLVLLFTLTLAVVFGKGLGGVLADRFGWVKIAGGALVVSMPLLAFWPGNPWLAIPGMFLFNTTMPVTLVAASNLLFGRPGLAFGVTCLALEAGVLMGQLPVDCYHSFSTGWVTLMTILVSVVALCFGLWIAFSHLPDRFAEVNP